MFYTANNNLILTYIHILTYVAILDMSTNVNIRRNCVIGLTHRADLKVLVSFRSNLTNFYDFCRSRNYVRYHMFSVISFKWISIFTNYQSSFFGFRANSQNIVGSNESVTHISIIIFPSNQSARKPQNLHKIQFLNLFEKALSELPFNLFVN